MQRGWYERSYLTTALNKIDQVSHISFTIWILPIDINSVQP